MDSHSERRIHRIAPKYRTLYSGLMVIVTVLCLAGIAVLLAMTESFMRYNSDYAFLVFPVGMILVLVLLLIFTVFILYIRINAHIITSPAGIEYNGLHFHLRSSWANVKAIEKETVQLTPMMVITFHNKPEILRKMPGVTAIIPYPMILLNEFGDWKHSSLGEEIQRYRPDLYAVETGPSWD